MTMKKFKMTPVFEAVTPHLQKAADKAKACKGAIDQFGALAQGLSGLEAVVIEADRSAHANWTESLASQAGALASGLERLNEGGSDEFTRATALETLIAALDGINTTLIEGASSLAIREPNVTPKPEVAEALEAAVGGMTEAAFDCTQVADLFREAAGHHPQALPTPLVYPKAKHCGGCRPPAVAPVEGEVVIWQPELALATEAALDLGHSRIQETPERLIRVLELLLALFLVMSVLGISCTCATECTNAQDSYIGNKLARSYADLVAARTYQPKMDVDWDWCCWDSCWVFWWDKWLTTVTTTHNLGGLFVLGPGRPVGVANTVARQRAAAANLAALTRPASPC